LFLEALEKYPDLEVQIVSLTPPPEECIKRIYKRNGGKQIKEDLVIEKCKAVNRSHKHFLEDGLNAWTWDNTDVTDEKLIHQLEKRLEEHRDVNNS
jgi:predicted ABC-type ATPase